MFSTFFQHMLHARWQFGSFLHFGILRALSRVNEPPYTGAHSPSRHVHTPAALFMGMLQKQLPGFTLFPAHVTHCVCAAKFDLFLLTGHFGSWRANEYRNRGALTTGRHVRTPRPLFMAMLKLNLHGFTLFPHVTCKCQFRSFLTNRACN